MNHIAAILPAFNTEAHLAEVILKVMEQNVVPIVVDDGSTDNTAGVAEKAGAIVIQHKRNMGKGAALKTGISYAIQEGYEGLFTLDADGQHDPSLFSRFLAIKAPVVIGNRMANPEGMPRIRRWTNRIMSRWLSKIVGQPIPDTQNGFRYFQTTVLNNIQWESDGYAAESELLIILGKKGVPIASVPLPTVYGEETSHIHPFRDTYRFFKMLMAYRKKYGTQ